MKKLIILSLTVLLTLACSSAVVAKEVPPPGNGFEDYICHYIPNGWYVCRVKPGKGPK